VTIFSRDDDGATRGKVDATAASSVVLRILREATRVWPVGGKCADGKEDGGGGADLEILPRLEDEEDGVSSFSTRISPPPFESRRLGIPSLSMGLGEFLIKSEAYWCQRKAHAHTLDTN
jgi:hypothetical protein